MYMRLATMRNVGLRAASSFAIPTPRGGIFDGGKNLLIADLSDDRRGLSSNCEEPRGRLRHGIGGLTRPLLRL